MGALSVLACRDHARCFLLDYGGREVGAGPSLFIVERRVVSTAPHPAVAQSWTFTFAHLLGPLSGKHGYRALDMLPVAFAHVRGATWPPASQHGNLALYHHHTRTDERVRTMRRTRAAAGGGRRRPKPGSMGPIGQNEFPLGTPKMDTDGPVPVPTPLPSAKSGRPPPTLAKFSSLGPSTGLGCVKTLECEQLKRQPCSPAAVWQAHSRCPAAMTDVIGKWRLGEELGTGHFAKVKMGTHIETGHTCAIKIVKKPQGAWRPGGVVLLGQAAGLAGSAEHGARGRGPREA
eukprot:scaffold3079_cov107-Isochrysis_galbana.AAC.2